MFFSSELAANGRQRRRAAIGWAHPPRTGRPTHRPNTALRRAGLATVAAGADLVVIVAAAIVAGLIYGQGWGATDTASSGVVIGLLFLAVNTLRHDYALPRYLTLKAHNERVLMAWVMAFGAALVLGFMTKTSAVYSRGALGIFFVIGYAALLLARKALIYRIRGRAEAGQITSRTIMLVGPESDIGAFMARYNPAGCGLKVVAASVLRQGGGTLQEDLALSVATARMLRPDDVFLLVPWSDPLLLDTCVDMFRRLPASIHLGPAFFLDRFDDMRIDRTGPISSVHLVRSPMSPLEIVAKRLFDIVGAGLILIATSPLLLLAALAIKLDSRGPVFFRQRRYGFNQEPFRIIKFRSMTTLEDSAALVQVSSGDTRVTRLGRLLRRTSIDELPQLINVLKGDMSLVGPRPHALAHDQRFERFVTLYARRHNVKPGITGWAQVRGWRGETDTPEKIRGRVEHDLHYIDNWSIWFDIAILVRTVLSRRTFENAQ